MKKTILFTLALAAIVAFGSNCTSAPTKSGSGLLFTSVKETDSVGANVSATKSGRSCSYSILGLVAIGDSSTEAAKKSGGLSKVAYVDREVLSVLSLFVQNCTVAYGE